MDNQKQLHQEIEEALREVSFTEAMKNNVRKACYGEKEQTKRSINPIRCKRSLSVALTFLVASTSILAVGVSSGLSLGKFFNQESISGVVDDIQEVKSADTRKNVKMEIEEVVNQGYSALMVVNFINEGDEKWPENIGCRKFQLLVDNQLEHSYLPSGKGVLSEDGKVLSYCVEIGDGDEIITSEDMELNATNLVTHEYTETDINVPLKGCNIVDVNNGNQERLDAKLQDKITRDSYMPELGSQHPGFCLLGVGYLPKGEDIKEDGIYIRTLGGTYFNGYIDVLEDAYSRGGIVEVKDIRTGKIYSALIDEDEDGVKSLDSTYFPKLKREDVPYLVATKLGCEKQEVVVYTTWQADFTIEENKSMVSWDTNIVIDELDKYKWGIDIKKVSLGSAGVQLTGIDKGNFDSRAIHVSLVDDKGTKTELKLKTYTSMSSTEPDSCFLSFGFLGHQEGLINVKAIKEIRINDQILTVEK